MKNNYKKKLSIFILMAAFLMVACEKKSLIDIPSTKLLTEEEATTSLQNISRGIDQFNVKLFGYNNFDDLASKIIQNDEFIYNWSFLANMLGFSWCSGTNSQYVGQNFDFKKIWKNGQTAYELKAHYNSSDPYAGGYRSDERLKLTIENIRFVKDPSSLNIYMKYDITLSGFLKWSWNGMNGFPKNRPYINIKFGGTNGQGAQEYLSDIYNKRNIQGYSNWDWSRIIDHYGQSYVDNAVNNIVYTQFGGVQK